MLTCRFCYNRMPAGQPATDHRDRLRGFTEHESVCGGRTDRCAVCGASVRLKDMDTHTKLHSMDMEGQGAALRGMGSSGGGAASRASSAVYVPTPLSPTSFAAARDAAWARAGFGDASGGGRGADDATAVAYRPPNEDAALQAAMRASLEEATAAAMGE